MSSDPTPEGGYPPQLHAGAVGYGPHFNPNPTLGDKIEGLKEEIKGKVKRNPEQVQHGKDIISGEQKRMERDADLHEDPFSRRSQDDNGPKKDGTDTTTQPGGGIARGDHKAQKEQAATVAPVGHPDHDMQRKGEAVDRVKHIG